MEKNFRMKLFLLITTILSLSALSASNGEFNKGNPAGFLPLRPHHSRVPYHSPLNLLHDRIRFLMVYPTERPIPTILPQKPKQPAESVIEPEGQITDFQARFELAKILSHSKEHSRETLKHYALLLKEKPHDPQLWLEISRFYIAQENFPAALEVLHALAYHQNLHFKLITSISKEESPKNATNKATQTIVTDNLINDDEVRLNLARLLSKNEKDLDEAIQFYQILLKHKPNDALVVLEISRLYIRQGKYGVALSYLYPAIDAHSKDAELLVEAAHAEMGLEHAKQSQDLLLKALQLSKKPEDVLLDLASVYMLVGSFYKAEAIYSQALSTHPQSLDLALKLGWALVSAQRYEEAEGLYRNLLLDHPDERKVLEPFFTLKMFEMDFEAALEIIDTLLRLCPQNFLFIELKANALYRNENYLEALEEFDRLSQSPKFYTKAMIGRGRIYKNLGQYLEAEESFQRAYEHDPSSIPAQFYQIANKRDQSAIDAIVDQTQNPKDLIEWGNVYAENGISGIIDFYEAALKLDADYSPAYTGLAEALSAQYIYDEAIKVYSSILDIFPENSKIMIAIARVLSWQKKYKCSMAWYKQIIALNPQDPLPRREIARVAYWGKFFDESMKLYDVLLYPTVDKLLLEALQTWQEANCGEESFLSSSLDRLEQSIAKGTIYTGYKTLLAEFVEFSNQLNCKEKFQIERILNDHLPLYRLQRAIFLERQAKALDWQGYSLHALPVYQELAEFSPGNQEGLYGYAQDFCALGLCNRSRHLYYHILHLEPTNSLINMALERNLLLERPLVQGNYTYWTERGSGQFANSQIARQQLDEMVQWSPRCGQNFRFIQTEWVEYPFFVDKYYPAEGQTIEADQVFSPYVKGVASFTYKNYFGKFRSRYTGLGTLWFNAYDYMQIGIGFERRNEIYNYFTLKQGTQADVYWASLKASNHKWNAVTTYRHLVYNDHNTLDHINLLVWYLVSEDPKVFKIIFDTSYRNTAHLTRLIISPTGKLLTIIHPYWTPQNYYSGSVTLEFRYNYAWFIYCEGPERYIDIKLTAETDSAHNPSGQLAINWKHEFTRWGFEVTGLFHRSRLWNADGIWARVYCRF